MSLRMWRRNRSDGSSYGVVPPPNYLKLNKETFSTRDDVFIRSACMEKNRCVHFCWAARGSLHEGFNEVFSKSSAEVLQSFMFIMGS